MITETKCWHKITLPVVWVRDAWGATTYTFAKYEKYFSDNNIEWEYISSGDPNNPTITYKVKCTDEELLLIRLSF